MLKFKDFSKIQLKEMDIPTEMLHNANKEPELAGYVNSDEKINRTAITHDNNVIGFLLQEKKVNIIELVRFIFLQNIEELVLEVM